MMKVKRFDDLYETNGPASGKKETTIKGLKGIPLTTDNPIITDPTPSEIDDEDITFSDEDISIEMEEPKPPIDRIKTKYKMKRTKRFEEMYENIGPALDGEFSTTKENIKKQGLEFDESKLKTMWEEMSDEEKKSILDLEGFSSKYVDYRFDDLTLAIKQLLAKNKK
jgi:hypothetical protein